METFDFEWTQRVIFGENSIERLGELTKILGGTRPLIVTDPGIQKAGILARVCTALESEQINAHVFSDIASNPTTQHVEAVVQFAKTNGPIDLIIGLGGGSAMDCAKGANFLLTNGGKMADYWGTNRATQPMLPAIGIPTTIGTGSEAQSYALISQEDTHIKMACGDKKARFRTVILDPTLTETLPRAVAAVTGIDAIAHAVESFVSTKRNPMSQMFSLHAWQLLDANFEMALQTENGKARGKMLFGAYLAGVAIENSMLGAAHACANPLTARYDITHGIAVALMLPCVIQFNNTAVAASYRELYATGDLVDRIVHLKQIGKLPNRLRDCSVKQTVYGSRHAPRAVTRADIPTLAAEASAQWTAQFNPRPLDIGDFTKLYETVF